MHSCGHPNKFNYKRQIYIYIHISYMIYPSKVFFLFSLVGLIGCDDASVYSYIPWTCTSTYTHTHTHIDLHIHMHLQKKYLRLVADCYQKCYKYLI